MDILGAPRLERRIGKDVVQASAMAAWRHPTALSVLLSVRVAVHIAIDVNQTEGSETFKDTSLRRVPALA